MKRLIFVNDDYKMNKYELEKFINILMLFDLLETYIPLISKQVDMDKLFFLLDKKFVTKNNNKIIYKNSFTKDNVEFIFNKNEILINNYLNDDSLKYIFYKISDNYLILDYWKWKIDLLII